MLTVETIEIIKRLRSEIASNVVRSRELRAEANAVHGTDRHKLHLRRRELGTKTRNRLLLLAYLRERPYCTVERSCRNEPSTYNMAVILEGVSWPLSTDEMSRVRTTTDAIVAWTKAVPAAVAAASPAEHAGVAA